MQLFTMQLFTLIVLVTTAGLAVVVPESASAAAPVRPDLPAIEPTTQVYKTVGGVELRMFIYAPPGHKPTDHRPAIVFFFGGGWRDGTTKQFDPQCRYLASRGMVAMAADYRVKNRHGVSPFECVADAKSAVRWVRAHHDKLGVDPKRIVAAGGSAGGHLAACTGVIEGFDEPGEDAAVSSAPNAMILFNPALNVTASGFPDDTPKRVADITGRFNGKGELISPQQHVRPGLPPTIIFHGKADTTVPYGQAQAFTAAMAKAGNRCQLVGAEGQVHGYFNYGRGDGHAFIDTLRVADQFLVSLGYLKGEPTLK